MASVLGSCKLDRKCKFWESCLDGGEGGLQGLLVGKRASGRNRRSRARGRDQGSANECWVDKESLWCFECFEVEERVAHAQGKQTNVFEDVGGGRSFVKLRCPGAFRERMADSKAGHQRRGEHARQSK